MTIPVMYPLLTATLGDGDTATKIGQAHACCRLENIHTISSRKTRKVYQPLRVSVCSADGEFRLQYALARPRARDEVGNGRCALRNTRAHAREG
jgi:hypothetical protein